MRRLVLAVAVALCLAGCGGSGGSAQGTVQAYYNGLAAGNYTAACQQLEPGMILGIEGAVVNLPTSESNLTLLNAAAGTISKHPTAAACGKMLAAIVKDSQLQTGELRFVKTTTKTQGKTAYVKVTGLPDTSSLLVEIAPSLVTVSQASGGWRISALG